ncbi:MAG: hypothetical protein ABJC26_01260 [Gemmatimonadaceae bacterium]
MKRIARYIPLLAMFSFALELPAQLATASTAKIPVRALGAIRAASKDSMGPQVVVRALSNGSVLINDIARRRVVMFDAALGNEKTVIDSAGTTGSAMATQIPSAQLMRYTADSTLYIDVATQALLVLDPSGKVARVMALPRPTDAILMATGSLGLAAMDPQGRLIYRGQYPPKVKPPEPGSTLLFSIPVSPDSGPLLRADFDARKVDTIGTVKIVAPGAITMTQDGQGNMTMKTTVDLLATADEFGILPDGSIAIVRAHDYHVDWIEADGSRRSTPKMAFDWRRLSDEQKQTKIDSMMKVLETQIASRPQVTIPTASGPRKLIPQIDFVPVSKMADYMPPIAPGSLKVDLKGNLWIVPRTSSSAAGGVLYDVVGKDGEVKERVQFPKGYALAGFGEKDEVYVLRIEGKTGFLEKAKLR